MTTPATPATPETLAPKRKPGRPPGPGPARDKFIEFRVTPERLAAIKKLAEDHDTNVSALINRGLELVEAELAKAARATSRRAVAPER